MDQILPSLLPGTRSSLRRDNRCQEAPSRRPVAMILLALAKRRRNFGFDLFRCGGQCPEGIQRWCPIDGLPHSNLRRAHRPRMPQTSYETAVP
jgi:hypothetical protein